MLTSFRSALLAWSAVADDGATHTGVAPQSLVLSHAEAARSLDDPVDATADNVIHCVKRAAGFIVLAATAPLDALHPNRSTKSAVCTQPCAPNLR